jgi:thiamine-monophosphate kinase
MTLALTLPQADEPWLADFARGLFSLAEEFDVSLVGGDTTQGPLTISIQVGGTVLKDRALLRSGARPGDTILVSGSLGDAGRAVQLLQQQALNVPPAYLAHLNRPRPQLQLGQALVGLATACIDISDGLYADLSHITEGSQVGATLEIDQLPLSATLRQDELEDEEKYRLALGGGDDYELCFTVSEGKLGELEKKLSLLDVEYTVIGRITRGKGVQLHSAGGREIAFDGLGYQHFT